MLQHCSPISGVASFENKYIATAGYDNRIILWDAKTRLPLAMGLHDHLANQCEFSPCGGYLASASSDHTARLWSVPQMKLLAVFSEHEDDIEDVAIHPTQKLVATASRDHKVRVFDFNGQLQQTLAGHTADVISVQWQMDGDRLISSSDDGTIRSWDIKLGKQINYINDAGIQTDTIALTENGIIFAGDDNGQIQILSQTKKQIIQAHQAGIKKIVYSAKNKKLVSVGYDRKACLWNISENSDLALSAEFTLPHIVWSRSCAFHNDHEIIFATFGSSYAVYNLQSQTWQLDHIDDTQGINAVLSLQSQVWSVGDAGIVRNNEQKMHKLPSLCNFLVRFGQVILTGGQSGEIFDAISGEVIYQHHSPLNCAVCFSEKYAAIGTYTGEAIILKNDNGKITYDCTVSLHNNAIKGLAVNNDILFSVCATGAAAWHSLKTYAELKILLDAHTKIANACIALNAKQFASISRDKILRLWDGTTFSLIADIPTPHTHSIKCLAIDTQNRYIATGSYNGLICVYDLQQNSWKTQRPTQSGISSICFDENHFLASSYDGRIYPIFMEK